ncbi:hypothetical protein HS125_11230 [bacterium]|nr:hypothetical protein [bacterium]
MKSVCTRLPLIVLFFLVTEFCFAQWNTSTIDSSGDTGRRNDVSISTTGIPHVVYIKNDDQLNYAEWTGESWSASVLYSAINNDYTYHRYVDCCAIAGWTSRITVVAFTVDYQKIWSSGSDGDDTLYLIVKSDEASTLYTLDQTVHNAGRSLSESDIDVVVIGDTAHVVAIFNKLNHYQFNLSTRSLISKSAVGEVGVPSSDISLISDSTGSLHLAYYESEDGDLKYAHFQGGSWSVVYVDTVGDVGKYNDIVIKDGVPHIFYYDATNGKLKHAVLR